MPPFLLLHRRTVINPPLGRRRSFRPKSAILTTNDTAFAFIGQLKALHNHVRPQREKLTILTSHQGFSVSFQFPIGQFDNGVGFMPGGLALRFFAQKLGSGIHVDLFA